VKAIDKRLREEFAKLRVEINEDKSRMVDLKKGESFTFLGFEYRRILSFNQKWRPYYAPKLKKRTALYEKAQGGLPTACQLARRGCDCENQSDSAGLGELLSGRSFEHLFLEWSNAGLRRGSGVI
jgi:hypothetical protein